MLLLRCTTINNWTVQRINLPGTVFNKTWHNFQTNINSSINQIFNSCFYSILTEDSTCRIIALFQAYVKTNTSPFLKQNLKPWNAQCPLAIMEIIFPNLCWKHDQLKVPQKTSLAGQQKAKYTRSPSGVKKDNFPKHAIQKATREERSKIFFSMLIKICLVHSHRCSNIKKKVAKMFYIKQG